MCKRCVTPYPTRPTRPLEHSHCRAKPPRTVRVHCEHLLMWYQCTGRTRRSGRSVYTGNPPRTVRERYARRVKLSVCTRPKTGQVNSSEENRIGGRIGQEGERRKSYSSAVIDGKKRKDRIYVVDSIMRKTDSRLSMGEDVVVCQPGARIEHVTERVEKIIGRGNGRDHTSTRRDEQRRQGRNNGDR